MKKIAKIIFIVGLILMPKLASGADPGDDSATVDISVTVETIMEWSSATYAEISLANITAYGDQPTGTRDMTLYTNCNLEISADNTAAAQLETASTSDTLVTEYNLSYDGDGAAATGGSSEAYAEYDAFLSTASSITHVDNDGAVVATLGVRASNPSGEVADAGDYTATQTLTASWTSD